MGRGSGGGKKEVEKATFPTLLTMIVVKTTLGLIYLYTSTIIRQVETLSEFQIKLKRHFKQ